jgi:hypothetical protein
MARTGLFDEVEQLLKARGAMTREEIRVACASAPDAKAVSAALYYLRSKRKNVDKRPDDKWQLVKGGRSKALVPSETTRRLIEERGRPVPELVPAPDSMEQLLQQEVARLEKQLAATQAAIAAYREAQAA